MEWTLSKQDNNAQVPSPRSVPYFHAINQTHAILFGGFLEHIEDNSITNCGENTFYNDIYLLDTTFDNSHHEDDKYIKWTRIYPTTSIAPPPRAYGCVSYSKNLKSLFLYGGITFDKEFTNVTSYSDTWLFDLTQKRWFLLENNAPPGKLSGIDCDMVEETNTIYLTHGTKDTLNNFQNNTWKWQVEGNHWTLLNVSPSHRPSSRALSIFRKIPGQHAFLFFDGLVLTSQDASKAAHFRDVWRFYYDTLTWVNQTVENAPSARGNFASTLTSSRWFYIFGGDISTNRSISDNCFPPLECYTSVNPNDQSYFLKLNSNGIDVQWSDELSLNLVPPPLRHSSLAVLSKRLYLVGGMGWNGQNGVGELYNFYTYFMDLNNNYFE